MATYADFFTPNLFFVTQRAMGNEVVLGNAIMVRLVQSALQWVGQRHPFEVVGYVFLPAHLHLLIEPTGATRVDQIMRGVREQFHREYQQLLGIPGETLLWENHHSAQHMPDSATFATQLDYIHYNPVQHGYVTQPAAWPYSSYQMWLARGLYAAEWGWTLPASISNKANKGFR